MDNFKPAKLKKQSQSPSYHELVVRNSVNVAPETKKTRKLHLNIDFSFIGKFRKFASEHQLLTRVTAGFFALIIVFSVFLEFNSWRQQASGYELSAQARQLLGPKSNKVYAEKLQYNQNGDKYSYNAGYKPSSEVTGLVNSPKFSAEIYADVKKGIDIIDPVSNMTVGFKPEFKMDTPKKEENRLILPIKNMPAAKVYTLGAAGVKEDIILKKYFQDTLSFKYNLTLPNGTEARIENDGSLGIYGASSTLLGNVTAGSDKDKELLEKARTKAEKTNLLFSIPAPFIVDSKNKSGGAKAWFELQGNQLTVYASGLKQANYPLTIDPTVYVESAANFMRGNNETNIDYDNTNQLIQKGRTTGARINAWTDTTEMNDGVWDQAMAANGGYAYRAGGRVDPTKPVIVDQRSTQLNTDNLNFVMDMPTVRPAGDLYVALIAKDGNNRVTPPGGWTEYADLQQHAAYYKVGTDQGGGNESATYTWTVATTAEQWSGTILRIKGFNSGTPISGTPTTGNNAANALPIFPAITPNDNSTLIIRAAGIDEDDPSDQGWLPLGHTKTISASTTGAAGTRAGLIAATLDVPSQASVSSVATTVLNDGTISDSYGSSSIAINPAAVTAGLQKSVQWARFNTSNSTIDSPNPGNGTCTGWCTNSVYDLPENRVGMTMVAYNGYLYAIGGTDGTSRKNTIYISKLGANGEPQKWHPTDTNKNNWVYWYSNSTLSNERSYLSAVASNNRLYVLGGQTNATPGGVTTVEYASFNPNGTLGAWSTGTALSTGIHSFTAHVYNDNLYVIGGNANGTLQNAVKYVKLNTNGSMNSWVTTSSFTTARSTMGGNYSTIWGAYIYLAGGCTALTSGYCSTIASDVQLASINADGSISKWNPILNLSNERVGYSIMAWQDGLYRFGGCGRQNTITGACYVTFRDAEFGIINQDGDASTVANSEPNTVAPCSGASPTNCDLPPAGDNAGQGGQMSSQVVINNGYIYNIGGCTNITGTNECSGGTGMSGNTSYAAIDSDGNMAKPATCGGTSYGLWCVDSTNRINGTAGVGAAAATVFNNTVYVIGGTNGTGAWTSNVYYASLNPDGSLAGAWTTAGTGTTGLPATFTSLGFTGIGYSYAFTRANPTSAGSSPGNLYLMGGCVNNGGVGCGTYTPDVYKCNIGTTGAVTGCTKTGQMQIDADNLTGGVQGLGLMAGAIYANRIYLVGGSCTSGGAAGNPCGSTYAANRKDTIYAKIDNSNNIVDNTTGLSTGAWAFTTGQMNPVRRRGVSFGYNGYIYSLAGYSGTASLRDLLFAKIDVSTGDMGVFSSSGVVVTPRWDLRAIVSNGYVYAIGGCGTGAAPDGCTALQPEIQTFQLYNNDSGAPASFTSSANNFTANTDRWGASSVVLNGYIYVAGGCISATDCTTATNSVQYAQLNASDGSIGSWNAGGNLPGNRTWGQLLTAGGGLYYVGGQDDTATNEQSTVYYTTGISAGNPTWAGTGATKGIGDTGAGAQARTKFGAAVWNNRIYVVGGLNASAAVSNTVYISPQMNSGGNITANWTSDADVISVARQGLAVTAYANNLYLFGGIDTGSNYLNDSQFTQINADGTIDAWLYSTPLPGKLSNANAFAANGYMYLVGGRSATASCAPNTLVAPISANTTIASGNNPTGTGDWYETNTKYSGGRYGIATAYSQGKAYLLGGGCTSPIGPNYTTGTISQTTTTVTGAGGTNWTDNYIGGTITYQDASTATILKVNSATSLTVSVSKTVGAGQTYSISVGRHNYAIFKSQPQVAKYSRLIDTDSNVFPTKWLMNGLDNSIGAKWQSVYKSAYDASNVIHHQSFDDGTNGVAVTEGNSSYDNCFEAVNATLKYSNSQYVTPGLSARFEVPTGNGTAACEDTHSLTTVRYDRFYVRFDSFATLSGLMSLMEYYNTTNSTNVTDVRVNTSGQLTMRDNFSTEATSAALAANTWHRIETSVSNDQLTLRTFEGANLNGTTPTQTFTITLNGSATNDFNRSTLGIVSNITSAWGMYIDEHKTSSSNWVGPAYPDWGQVTNFGDVTLGQPENYIPLDAAGVDSEFARWYLFSLSIDASQTFGYPEDVNRGPTISDLSLFFSADPSKRMRHGKTFTGGEKQPLDTPFP